MFSTIIGKESLYDFTEKKFQIAFDFLKRNDLADLPEGWIELEDGVKASIQHYCTTNWSENMFETHDKYFDVQYVIEGFEYFGVCKREGLIESIPYSEENEITFYKEPQNSSRVLLEQGDFIIVGPDEAHKPRCSGCKSLPVKKVVVKVPVKD